MHAAVLVSECIELVSDYVTLYSTLPDHCTVARHFPLNFDYTSISKLHFPTTSLSRFHDVYRMLRIE
jgi:hypothetical protein